MVEVATYPCCQLAGGVKVNKHTKGLIRKHANKVLPPEALAIPRELVIPSNANIYLVTTLAEPGDYALHPPYPTGVYITCLMVMSLDELKAAGVLTAQTITGMPEESPMTGDGKVRAKPRVSKVTPPTLTPQQLMEQMKQQEEAMREKLELLKAKLGVGK